MEFVNSASRYTIKAENADLIDRVFNAAPVKMRHRTKRCKDAIADALSEELAKDEMTIDGIADFIVSKLLVYTKSPMGIGQYFLPLYKWLDDECYHDAVSSWGARESELGAAICDRVDVEIAARAAERAEWEAESVKPIKWERPK